MKRARWFLLGLAVFCTPLFVGWHLAAKDSIKVEKFKPTIPLDLPIAPNRPEAGSSEKRGGVFIPQNRPIRRNGGEAGSIEKRQPRIPRIVPARPEPAESGSSEKTRPTIPRNIPIPPRPAESGSTEKPQPTIPRMDPQPGGAESGSTEKTAPGILPIAPQRAESGSREKPGIVVPLTPGQTDPGSQNQNADVSPFQPGGIAAEAEIDIEDKRDVDEGSIPLVTSDVPDLVLPAILLVGGLFLVGWSLFRMGLFNPYTANIWPKRLELCLEIALRTDDFMTAFHEGNFSKCQMALDALNHLNGRRSIILSNEINAAVNRFVEQAVDCKVSKNSETFQKELGRRYEVVIEALRTGTRQEELSLEVLRSLTKAQGPHRKLREPVSGDI